MKRDYSYDWLRAFSAVMIVLCHICQGFGISSTLGYYLGGTYVSVFLILSAYLLGERYRERIAFSPLGFLKARMNRLIPTYYTFLTITFILIELGIGEHLTMHQMTGHYLFLNWFVPSTRIWLSPLPQLGHLWFMSCIVLTYMTVTAFSLIPGHAGHKERFWLWLTLGTVLAGTILCFCSRWFVYPSVVMVLYPLVFFKGHEMVSYTQKVSRPLMFVALLLCNLGAILGFRFGLYDYPPLVFWTIGINAVLWIVSAPVVFNRRRIPNPVVFVSAISFEIYLVHHPFCLGCYSLAKYMPVWLAVIVVFALSISLGYLLNLLAKGVSCCIDKLFTPPDIVYNELSVNCLHNNALTFKFNDI